MKATLYTYRTSTGELLPGKLEAYVINDQGRRYWVSFSNWERTYYRTTNKRTGAPLKKAVVDHITRNALLIDTQIDKEETNGLYYDWQDTKKYYQYIFTGSRRDSTTEKMARDLDLTYTEENILLMLKHITGRDYDGINIVHGEAVKPAAWDAIEEKEKEALRLECISDQLEILGHWVNEYLNKGQNISRLLLEKINALQEYSGTSYADVAKIENLVKHTGGFYEKNIIASCGRVIIKETENSYKIYNLCQGNYFRIYENRITA